MKSFAVVTPTYNREQFLTRLYDSLKQQNFPFKDFSWIIIDDGSSDSTDYLVKSMKSLAPFEIVYLFKENGGKHTAWKYAVEWLRDKEYKYFISIDSDDVLTFDALSVFYYHWKDIESRNLPIGIINARTMVYGAEDTPHVIFQNVQYIDDTYHNVALKYGEQSEMITSIRVEDLDTYLQIPDVFWLSDKVKFFSENILWGRAGRKIKSRYLKNVLRIVHTDADNQISHNKSKRGTQHLYNYIVGIKYFSTENLDYIVNYQKQQLLLDIIKYGAMCMITGIPFKEAYHELERTALQLLYVLLFPISIAAMVCFYIKRYL